MLSFAQDFKIQRKNINTPNLVQHSAFATIQTSFFFDSVKFSIPSMTHEGVFLYPSVNFMLWNHSLDGYKGLRIRLNSAVDRRFNLITGREKYVLSYYGRRLGNTILAAKPG
jgi:hypothetical protein